jgi:hypothetical protein
MKGEHESLALGVTMGEQRNGRRVPHVIADADEAHADEDHPEAVRKAHQHVGNANPEHGEGHEIALPPYGVDDDAARHVRDRPGCILDRHDETDLGIGKPQLFADRRQKDVESGEVPVLQSMSCRAQPYLPERSRRTRWASSVRHDVTCIPTPRTMSYAATAERYQKCCCGSMQARMHDSIDASVFTPKHAPPDLVTWASTPGDQATEASSGP